MRKLGFALAGLVLGAGLALVIELPQSAGARAMDPQGLHLVGVIFVALPLGAVAGVVCGLIVERLSRRWGLDAPQRVAHGWPHADPDDPRIVLLDLRHIGGRAAFHT